MITNPLLEKIKAKKTALGLFLQEPGMVELSASLGFDWFMIDQMFTGLDWGKTQYLIRTAKGAGITPVVRVQSNPWIGYDHRIAVDVTRAQGIGAQFIFVSNSCCKEIEECFLVSRDWHRNPGIVHPFNNSKWDKQIDEMGDETFIIPQVETLKALDEMEETLALPGLRMFFFAMTDASRAVTGQKNPDWYNPKLWKYVDKAVKIGEKKGIVIGANTSYAYTMKEMRERVKRLHDAGIKMIAVQGATFLFKVAMNEFLAGVKEDLNLT